MRNYFEYARKGVRGRVEGTSNGAQINVRQLDPHEEVER